jgi:hypothetical protein
MTDHIQQLTSLIYDWYHSPHELIGVLEFLPNGITKFNSMENGSWRTIDVNSIFIHFGGVDHVLAFSKVSAQWTLVLPVRNP